MVGHGQLFTITSTKAVSLIQGATAELVTNLKVKVSLGIPIKLTSAKLLRSTPELSMSAQVPVGPVTKELKFSEVGPTPLLTLQTSTGDCGTTIIGVVLLVTTLHAVPEQPDASVTVTQ